MSFVVNRNEDTWNFLGTGNYPTTGGWLDNKFGSPTMRGPCIYYDRLDIVIWDWILSTTFPGGTSDEICRFDPLFLDNSGSLFDAVDEPGTISGLVCNDFALGYWDRLANTQKVYTFNNGVSAGGKPFHEVQPLALNVVNNLDVWSNVGTYQTRNGLSSGTQYFYGAGAGTWLFFEEYGKGYLINCSVNDDGGTDKQGVLAEVDLATGNAVIVPTPVSYTSSIVHDFAEAPLRGQDVVFSQMQFVQDDDSTGSRPKGQMYLFSDSTNLPGDSTYFRTWMKIIDWNPTAFAGIPNRIHLRERLLSAVSFKKATPAQLDGIHESGTRQVFPWIYHPRSNLLFISSSTASGVQLAANQQKLMYMQPSAVFDHITEPYAMSRIATGKTVSWAVEALGDLQEPITGVDVKFTLENESTVGEVLNVTPTPGETVTLANTVKPTDAVVSPITVYEDGVALTETTHYTLNRGSSQITFVSPKPLAGKTYTADYRHWDDPQASPHGNLLSGFSSSDEDGVAITRIRYGEEASVKDRWDRLTAEDI